MKLTTILIISLSFSFLCAFSQSQSDKDINDIIKLKKQNIKYQRKIETETYKSVEFYNLALANTQSAKLILNKIIEGSANEDSDKDIASLLFHKANLYTKRSDSVANIISALQDSLKLNISQIYTLAKNLNSISIDTVLTSELKEAKKAAEQAPVVINMDEPKKEVVTKKEIIKPEVNKIEAAVQPKSSDKIYTVQIRADKQRGDLIKGMDNLKVIKCKDGYYRYCAGEYHNFSEAAKAQKKLSGEGYSDCFVKAMPEEE